MVLVFEFPKREPDVGRDETRGLVMKKMLAVAFVAAAIAGTSSTADARDGCGLGWHAGPHGRHCFRNTGSEEVIINPGVGVFVTGHGYWDGHRYWWHRDRWHGGWRYR